jgi:hypothetical protein
MRTTALNMRDIAFRRMWWAPRGRFFFTPWPPAAALSATGGVITQPLLQGAKPRERAVLGACTGARALLLREWQ